MRINQSTKMIFTVRFVSIISIGAVLIGLSGRMPLLAAFGSGVIALAVAVAVVDWVRLIRGVELEIERSFDEKLSLGAQNPVRIRLRNTSYTTLRGRIRDEYPVGIEADREQIPVRLNPRSQVEVVYKLTPHQRGDYEFGNIYVRLAGSLGLVVRQMRFKARARVKVYPNLLDIRRYHSGLRRRRLLQPGRKATRIYGRGTDFESLRDYLPDDELRSVDWKATAKRDRLTTRQYQQEKSQNVLVAMDCGRTMGSIIGGLTRLDHAINAAMMLTQTAVEKGDRVGLFAFGEDVKAFVPPRSGRSQLIRMLSTAYNLQGAADDSDYAHAFAYLAAKWTRRSLLVIFTDLGDAESSREMVLRTARLARKHLCVLVSMSDPSIAEYAYTEPTNGEAAFRAAAARQALESRRLAAAQLTGAGVMVIDVLPSGFAASVVERYLDIKARALL